MSVRRLAEVTLQPPVFAFSEAMSQQADSWIAKYPEGRQQSAVIPLLMLAQEQDGWVTKAAIEGIANMLRMPYIRVLEVATFYTQFQLKPVGSKAHIQVCGTTPCMLRGSEALMDVCRHKIHHDQFHLNASGTLSWEEVECLGACVNAPMVMIFKDTYEDLTPERLGAIIEAFEQGNGESIEAGPQDSRFGSAPASGQTTLLDEQVFIRAKREYDERAEGAPQPAEVSIPPSKAAKPATDTIETNAAFKSPSPVKVDRSTEGAKETEVPAHDAAAADKGEPAVEGVDKDRARPIRAESEPAPYKAPELQAKPQAGESGKTVEAGSTPSTAEPGTGGSRGASDRDAAGGAPKPEASIDALGTAMGAAAAPERGPPAPAITAENVAPGPAIQVSDSNAVSNDGVKLASEPEHQTQPLKAYDIREAENVKDAAPASGATPEGADRASASASGGASAPAASSSGGGAPAAQPSLASADRPAGIERPAEPDDLKLISGVGPKIEGTLHSLGIYTFAQIASWSEAERHWVDGYLRFHGRIERDDWVRQAKALADGGVEEYVRVFGKKPH